MTLAPGSKLGAYTILATLGAGGMGEVYRARDARLDRDVAVKVLPREVASDPDRLARFEREAKTVAALNHPGIVVLHSIEEANGVRFLTMELVEGRTLDGLAPAGGLPLSRVLDVVIPLADALAAAHERGIVHRDLKPANVMLTREGRVKVLDFGLAKLAAPGGALDATQAQTLAAPVSTAGQVVGTVPYMAPEQARGEPTDARTDLFALGVLMYELATGRRPFTGATSADVISAILRDAPEPVSAVRTDLPADLARVIGRCLEKDPERRVQTAKDVRNELELLRPGAASPASTASSASRVRPAPTPAAPARELPSIAVLPFVNRSRDENDEYFAEGLADELINVLAKIRGLRVAARSSSSQFKGKGEDLATIGKKLNVGTLLEGSVRTSGPRVRISVQLVKVADGFHLWSETYDRTMDDIFAVQDDIAQSVVRELRTTLLGEAADSKASGEVRAEVAIAAAGRGADAEAHRMFMQGRYFMNRHSHADVTRGIALLHQALEIEPGHALAWSCLSWAETFLAITTGVAPDAGIARGREAAARALAVQPDLPEALLASGWIDVWYDFAWTAAETKFRRALELAPGNADVLRANGTLAYILCRFDDALALCQRSLAQDPLVSISYAMIARIHSATERLAESEEAFRKALEISPESTSIRCLLSLVLSAQERHDEALAEAQRESTNWARLFALAIVQFRGGRPEESRQALEQLTRDTADSAAYQIAASHAVRGEADAAFAWLERSFAQRDSGMAFLRGHAHFRPLHGDPRWRTLLDKMGFPD